MDLHENLKDKTVVITGGSGNLAVTVLPLYVTLLIRTALSMQRKL